METTKITKGEAIFDLPEWQFLQSIDPQSHFFNTADYLRVWWETFGDGKELIGITFGDVSPAGFAALTLDDTETGRRLRFLGGDDLTDYLGPLVSPGNHKQIADALLRAVLEGVAWDYFDAKFLPVPFGFADRFAEAAHSSGMPFTVEQQEVSAVLHLPPTVDDYFQRLPGKNRHELRRKIRRFDENADGAALRSATSETMEADMDTVVAMHRRSFGQKGQFMTEQRKKFFGSLTNRFGQDSLSIDFLETAEGPASATIGFRHADVFYLYNSAFDSDQRALSPGLLLVAKLIFRAIEDGMKTFDFLRGSERYKFDLGAQAIPLHSVVVHRRKNRNRLTFCIQ